MFSKKIILSLIIIFGNVNFSFAEEKINLDNCEKESIVT